MKRYYNLEISYEGQNYFGWQRQKDFVTVQGTIENILKEIVESNFIRTIGSSRTDTGVHALANVCFVQIPTELTPIQLKDRLNQALPPEIRVNKCERTYKQFKVIYFADRKTYFYLFKNEPSEINSNYFTNIEEKLDIEKMKEAAKFFEGLHNFTNFSYKPSKNAEMTKEVFKCEIIEDQHFLKGKDREGCFALVIEGSGFLKQMIRIMMGALFNIGKGLVTIEDIQEAFSTTEFKKTGYITPGAGLYLKEIEFIRDPFKGHVVKG
jgi:tRNA pseudouridine38-40 synthase